MTNVIQIADEADMIINGYALNDREIRKIQTFIKNNYQEMYLKWASYSRDGYYEK